MNIIIYTVLILSCFIFFIKVFCSYKFKKNITRCKNIIIYWFNSYAILFAVAGKFLLTLPLTLASLALLKLKGLSFFQLISLFRLIQTLRNSGRFSFNNKNVSNSNTMTTSEAYKILNLRSVSKNHKRRC